MELTSTFAMPNEEIQDVDLENNEVISEQTAETVEDTTDYKAEAAKWKAIAQRNKSKSALQPQPEVKLDESIVSDVQSLKLAEKKRQFGYSKGLSPEETDKLFQFAGSNDPDKALEDSFFQAGLKEMRAAKRADDAIPSSSNRSTAVDGKTFKDMSEDERKKNWGKIMAGK